MSLCVIKYNSIVYIYILNKRIKKERKISRDVFNKGKLITVFHEDLLHMNNHIRHQHS